MFRHVPNILTGGRLLLAIAFFTMLGFYQFDGRGDRWLLNLAFGVYLVALVTDFLDGYLARKWQVEGAFGRVVDPFVDKVLVLGSFAFFAGKNFIIPDAEHFVVRTITGVAPGHVVILLARELLVTSLRGQSEAGGKDFGAAISGKIKMVVQSGTILAILIYVNYLDWLTNNGFEKMARIVRDDLIWLTIAVTVISGIFYIQRGAALFRRR